MAAISSEFTHFSAIDFRLSTFRLTTSGAGMNLEELLKKMCLIPALSGYEGRMAAFLREELAPFSDQVTTDPLASLSHRQH